MMSNPLVETPLEWSERRDGCVEAVTPFGSYRVEPADREIGILSPRWSYCFDEYYDEGQFECASVDEGKALAQAHWDERVGGIFRVRATPPAAVPDGWVMRDLVWEEIREKRSNEDPNTEVVGWEAATAFDSYYLIEQYFGTDSYGWHVTHSCASVGDYDDPDLAKAAAQADYERRILSALSAAPAAPTTPKGQRDAVALIRWAHDTLYEINPSNYDHDEVCRLNDASVEVILGLAQFLGERQEAVTDDTERSGAAPAAPNGWQPIEKGKSNACED